MHTVQSGEKSGQEVSLLEWQTCDSDAEWQTPAQVMLTTAVSHPDVTPRTSWAARYWRIGAVLVVLVAAIGSWTWSVAQRGVDQIEAELQERVELDLWTTASQDDGLRPASEQEIHKHFTSAQGDAARPLTSTVQLLALAGDTAIVQLVTQSGANQPTLRQTRFYRQTVEGWQRTKPNDNLWGPPHRLESGHFIFQYRQNDASAVAAVAPQIDALYTKLLHNFGLTPDTEKLVIEVTVEQVTGATPIVRWPLEPLVVPSPTAYFAPVELSDSAILAQSIALPLIEYMGERAIKDHTIPTRWRSFLLGMRLWQLWDSDMPLAHWRHEVVTSLYPDGLGRQPIVSDTYTELCGMHNLWVLSPMMVGIPFECHISAHGSWVVNPWLANLLPRASTGCIHREKATNNFMTRPVITSVLPK